MIQSGKEYRMLRRMLVTVVAVAAVLSVAATKPYIYRNPEFGITLPVPEGAFLCNTRKDEHDHGPVMLLGVADTKGCYDMTEEKRHIEVFASYNAVDETKTLKNLFEWQFSGPLQGKRCSAPPHLEINGLACMAGRINRANGVIVIFVVTQAGKPDPAFDPTVPTVNYELMLYTRPEHLKEDLQIFRKVLRTVRLSP
jgi:hypothetical protein